MKNLRPICLLLLLVLISCSKDEETELILWDCMPYKLFIDIQDPDSNNLFSDQYHGIVSLDSIVPEITYTYRDETKPVIYVKSTLDHVDWDKFLGVPVSRDYPTPFIGIYVYEGYFKDKHPQICFGEFDGTEDHEESVILNWPDGTQSKIELSARAVSYNGPSHLMKIRIDDGEWMEADASAFITFTK